MMIVTYRVMPEDGEVEYSKLEKATRKTIEKYHKTAKIMEINEHNVGFGLKAVKVKFSVDESMGSENLENQLRECKEVGDVVVEAMSRAMG